MSKADALERRAEEAEERARQLRAQAEAARLEQEERALVRERVNAISEAGLHLRGAGTRLLIASAGDWCQLERDGKILFRGHLTDLDAQELIAVLDLDIEILPDRVVLEDDRSFA